MNNARKTPEFREEFERFLTEFRQNRVADVGDVLSENEEYKKLVFLKRKAEDTLEASLSSKSLESQVKAYIIAVDDLADKIKEVFYDHGFKDCLTVIKTLQKDVWEMPVRSLLEIDTTEIEPSM